MEWDDVMKTAKLIVDAHPGLKPGQYAQLLQHQFQDQPMLGYFILRAMENKTERKGPATDDE